MTRLQVHIAFGILLCMGGCTEKYSMSIITPLENTKYTVGDTTYLEVSRVPILEANGPLNGPTALLIGKDNLLYVADTKNNRIVAMNVAGIFLSERDSIIQPISMTQDFRLDLLIGCCVVRPNGDTVAAIIRMHLYDAQGHLDQARIDTVWKESAQPRRRFVGISTMPDNSYLAARTGPDNSSFIDPDTRIMEFSAADRYITPITDMTSGIGTGITYINQVTGLFMFPSTRTFIVLQKTYGVAYGAIEMVYSSSSDFEGWKPMYDPTLTSVSVDMFKPYQFVNPTGVAFDTKRLAVIITDAAQDSVFKFDSRGKLRSESFGSTFMGGRMKYPTGVAYFDRTVFVSDAVANCIFRFRLSIDF